MTRPKFCMECGAALPEGAKFCPECGTKAPVPAGPPILAEGPRPRLRPPQSSERSSRPPKRNYAVTDAR